uniref:AN1-type domain-containing protein n=1 Tax=Amblyomma maculatum TaxID=34609 RepID=G3MSX0_AMBMU
MNMCSKCHKDLVLKQEQAEFAASSFDCIVNGGNSSSGKEPIVNGNVDVVVPSVEPKTIITSDPSGASPSTEAAEVKPKEGPSRCNTCRKRVGLTGFNCRCGYIFCATHRYSDKHNCQFDYRTEARDAIAKANPVVKADKLDKM